MLGYCLLDNGTETVLDVFMMCVMEGAGDLAVATEMVNYLKRMRLNSLRPYLFMKVRCEDFDMCLVLNSLGLHCEGYDTDDLSRDGDLVFSYSLADEPLGLPYYEKDLDSD